MARLSRPIFAFNDQMIIDLFETMPINAVRATHAVSDLYWELNCELLATYGCAHRNRLSFGLEGSRQISLLRLCEGNRWGVHPTY